VNPRWHVHFKGELSPDAEAELAQWGADLVGQQVGIALLVVLMSLAFYNDISRHLN